MTCQVPDCHRQARSPRPWCQGHENPANRPPIKCPVCRGAMREPAPACGFCIAEGKVSIPQLGEVVC
jgi:hypothetical protein